MIRSPQTLDEDGENKKILWKPDSTSLAVITTKGYVHFYDLVLPQPLFSPHQLVLSSKINEHSNMIGQISPESNRFLSFKTALEIDNGFTW